jgi:hypothetical protein
LAAGFVLLIASAGAINELVFSGSENSDDRACTLMACESAVGVTWERFSPSARAIRLCVNGRCRRETISFADRRQGIIGLSIRNDERRERSVPVTAELFDGSGRSLARISSVERIKRVAINGEGCPGVCFSAWMVLSGDRLKRSS